MRAIDLFDNYLEGKLSAEEKLRFEAQLKYDEVLTQAFEEHKKLIAVLSNENSKQELKSKLQAIHDAEFGIHSRIISLQPEKTFAKRHGNTMAIAASTALIAVLSTLAVLSTGGYLLKQQNNDILELKRNVMELKYSNDGIVEGITKKKPRAVYAPANLEGSAFAINNKGYIITSYHMVKSADSIFIQNENTERTHTRLIYTDESLDLAVLKVDNNELVKNWQVPFSLKNKMSDVGDKVFTLGYPRTEMVYGEGSVSSLSGYSNDTSMYQISIPVNPGNSGGPLLDEQGNIIGVVRGKISSAEATGFAIKANHILQSIEENNVDSVKQDLSSLQSKKSGLKGLKRSEQIKRIHPYVFNVLVYKAE